MTVSTSNPAEVEANAERDDHDGKAVDFIDIVMLVLAIGSVAMLLYAWIWDPALETTTWFILLDAGICAVFAIEFGFRWKKTGWQGKYPLTHWYEILGMVPIVVTTLPFFRAFRLLRIVIVVVRLARVIYRIFGEKVTNDIVGKITTPVVEAVKRPVIVLALDEVIGVLKNSNITGGLAQALRENQDELQQMVLQKLKEDRTTGRLKLMPFHDQVVETAVSAAMRVVLEVLADPRVEELVRDVIDENYHQIRRAVVEDLDAEDIKKLYAEQGQLKPVETAATPVSPAPSPTPTPSPTPSPTPTPRPAEAASPSSRSQPEPAPAPAPSPPSAERPAPSPERKSPPSSMVQSAIDDQYD